jgi:hypothetical protein
MASMPSPLYSDHAHQNYSCIAALEDQTRHTLLHDVAIRWGERHGFTARWIFCETSGYTTPSLHPAAQVEALHLEVPEHPVLPRERGRTARHAPVDHLSAGDTLGCQCTGDDTAMQQLRIVT